MLVDTVLIFEFQLHLRLLKDAFLLLDLLLGRHRVHFVRSGLLTFQLLKLVNFLNCHVLLFGVGELGVVGRAEYRTEQLSLLGLVHSFEDMLRHDGLLVVRGADFISFRCQV